MNARLDNTFLSFIEVDNPKQIHLHTYQTASLSPLTTFPKLASSVPPFLRPSFPLIENLHTPPPVHMYPLQRTLRIHGKISNCGMAFHFLTEEEGP